MASNTEAARGPARMGDRGGHHHHPRARPLRARRHVGRPARRRDQEPAAEPAARHHHRVHHRHRDLLPAAVGVHRRDPAQPDHRPQGLGGSTRRQPRRRLPVRRRGEPGRAGLAGAPPADRRVRLPVRHRADLPDVNLARRLWPGPQPVLPAGLRQDRQERRPLVQPDHRVPVRPAVPAALPELALPGRPGHLGQRADVRGSAALAGRVPRSTRSGRHWTGSPRSGCRST